MLNDWIRNPRTNLSLVNISTVFHHQQRLNMSYKPGRSSNGAEAMANRLGRVSLDYLIRGIESASYRDATPRNVASILCATVFVSGDAGERMMHALVPLIWGSRDWTNLDMALAISGLARCNSTPATQRVLDALTVRASECVDSPFTGDMLARLMRGMTEMKPDPQVVRMIEHIARRLVLRCEDLSLTNLEIILKSTRAGKSDVYEGRLLLSQLARRVSADGVTNRAGERSLSTCIHSLARIIRDKRSDREARSLLFELAKAVTRMQLSLTARGAYQVVEALSSLPRREVQLVRAMISGIIKPIGNMSQAIPADGGISILLMAKRAEVPLPDRLELLHSMVSRHFGWSADPELAAEPSKKKYKRNKILRLNQKSVTHVLESLSGLFDDDPAVIITANAIFKTIESCAPDQRHVAVLQCLAVEERMPRSVVDRVMGAVASSIQSHSNGLAQTGFRVNEANECLKLTEVILKRLRSSDAVQSFGGAHELVRVIATTLTPKKSEMGATANDDTKAQLVVKARSAAPVDEGNRTFSQLTNLPGRLKEYFTKLGYDHLVRSANQSLAAVEGPRLKYSYSKHARAQTRARAEPAAAEAECIYREARV